LAGGAAVGLQQGASADHPEALPDCHAPAEYKVLAAARRVIAKYADMEELIRMGAYKPGSDADIDAAIRFAAPVETFLTQRKHERMSADQSFAEVYRLLGEAGIDVPLAD
jgi:flagellum-specific ATP synthase